MRRSNVPFVVTTHGVYVRDVMHRRRLVKRVWAEVLERPYLRQAAAVHVYFAEERVSMQQALGVRPPTIVVPNGTTTPDGVKWDGGSGGYLLWLGRYDIETKGLDLLLRALHSMPSSDRPIVRLHGPDWRNQKHQLRTLVAHLDLEAWVILGDPIYGEEKWKTMMMASGGIYPSRWDACPGAVLEAAAIGMPMVLTRYPLANMLGSKDAALQADVNPQSIAEGIRMRVVD